MATVTHDGQSFLLDGRRIWLVSGLVDYFRIPRADWAARIRDAVEGGLNAITIRCPWSIHEPRKGEFRFEDETDVVAFVEMAAEAGLYCILRPGPFVGGDLDLGGMPSWLLAEPDLTLREGNGPFLEATARYFGQLLGRLSKFSAGNGGPIVLVQVEHEWYCGNQVEAENYLLEIARFIREHDFDVPLINTNNLWQRREESIDTWSGRDQMLMHLRQLRAIHPDVPLLVGDFWTGEFDAWGEERRAVPPAPHLMHQLAQVVAAGAEFSLAPFHSGTNFGFMSGRLVGSTDRYTTTSADAYAPVGEAGRRGDAYRMLRRLCTFTSQFGRVMASLSPENGPAVAAVGQPESGRRTAAGVSVNHLRGSQGDVVFVFGDEGKANQSTTLLLPNGRQLPVYLGDQPVAWCLMKVHLGGRARLDWTNLNAFAMAKRTLVLYGAAGQPGIVNINFSDYEVEVPRGQQPIVEVHEDVTLVICNGATVDATAIRGDTVYVGVEGFDEKGEPIGAPGWKSRWEIAPGGEMTRRSNGAPAKRPPAIRVGDWQAATIDDYISGEAPRFATIEGPSTQERCAAGSGYGIMRIALPKGPGRKVKVFSPGIGDRVHFYIKSQLKALVGRGPGASAGAFDLHVPGGKAAIVALIDNLGRFGGGNDMMEGKGIVSPLYEVAALRIGKPKVEDGVPLNVFHRRSFLEGIHQGETTSGRDLVWTFNHRRKSALIVEIEGALSPAMVVVNGEPIAFYSGRTGRPALHLVLNDEQIKRGNNELRLAPLVAPEESDLAAAVRVWEIKSELTAGAAWAFAKWEQPRDEAFAPMARGKAKALAGKPVWWRTRFMASDEQPVWFEPTGLTKGQIYLNGRNVGRYWVATAEGKAVPPQARYYLPAAWFNPDGENQLVIFDEHGGDATKSRIVYADSAF